MIIIKIKGKIYLIDLDNLKKKKENIQYTFKKMQNYKNTIINLII